MASIHVTHFTDPGCPWAFSAEPFRLQLLWHYGDQIEVETRMIVLSDSPDDYARRGYTIEQLQQGFTRIQALYGMPISVEPRAGLHATAPACRAYVAARAHDEAKADLLLRELRVRAMAGGLLDDPAVIDAAAEVAGIGAGQLRAWTAEEHVEEDLAEDRRMARTPSEPAVALRHKLAETDEGGLRYTAPSMEFEVRGGQISAPGMQPFESYEVALANLAPARTRRPAPESAREALEWAPHPLATAEVAALRGVDIEAARAELEPVATFEPVGADGYWSLTG